MDRCTSITVAHRLATVQRAQVVAVLDHGEIAASGTHEALLATYPPYARLFALPVPEDDADVRPAIAV